MRRRRASVLVPLIVSTTSHQRDNALFMAQHGAALHLPQTELQRHEPGRRCCAAWTAPRCSRWPQKATGAGPAARAAARVADEIERLVRRVSDA